MLSPGGGPRRGLLDAAHIVLDEDEQLGQPVISNGLPLTKIHHAAFDAHLIGIDPDYGIHVSDRLLEIRDGPFLEFGLKGIVGQVIQLPRRSEDRPDRDRLAIRFEQFTKASWPSIALRALARVSSRLTTRLVK